MMRVMRALRRLAIDAPSRHVMWLRWLRPRGAFQPFNDTAPDRYPEVFAFVQSQLGADSTSTILSFGCATGEEAFTLRDYLPGATIKGIDVNPANIAVCRHRLGQKPDTALSFATAHSTRAEPTGAFDAIFAMAVLRHGSLGRPGITRCDHLIRFTDFAQAVEDFSRCLKPGGLLAIAHSNFRLCDTPAGAAFETVLRVARPADVAHTPLFGPDNLLMPSTDYLDTVFRKRA